MFNGKKIVAVMPIKMNNERLPGKNTRLLGDKPLLRYQLDMILEVACVDNVYVYCSDPIIRTYLPERVSFLRRDEILNLPTANFTEIFQSFMEKVEADVYIYVHATAPFVSRNTVEECLNAVLKDNYDSAFCAVKIQDFLWKDTEPLNFEADELPRSQDLDIIWRETSGIYVFEKDVFQKLHRRIGEHPYIKEVTSKEAVDINTVEDFHLAEMFLDQ